MSPSFISAILGLTLMVMTLGAVSPSVLQGINSKKIEVSISREEALAQQVIRYQAIVGSYPANVAALVSAGYWKAADNDNGFGGSYSFTVDAAKGVITTRSTISDAGLRGSYIGNYRHNYKPADIGGGVVSKSFIVPSAGTLSAPLPSTTGVVVSATAPSAATNTYWYDISGGAAVLKVSNGATWTSTAQASSGGGGASSLTDYSKIYSSESSLPSNAPNGTIAHTWANSGYNRFNTYVRIQNMWLWMATPSS